jgi:hypothetical protein
VAGDIAGNPMNIVMVMGVFAALSREAGIPLRFPGSHTVWNRVFAQTTDAGWMARASVWAALDPAARNEAFNLVGEPFRWRRCRPRRRWPPRWTACGHSVTCPDYRSPPVAGHGRPCR